VYSLPQKQNLSLDAVEENVIGITHSFITGAAYHTDRSYHTGWPPNSKSKEDNTSRQP
jgi:hypothetical protein